MSQELQKCGVSVNILKIVGGGWGWSNEVTTMLIYVRLFEFVKTSVINPSEFFALTPTK
jgi:hypothetical protein